MRSLFHRRKKIEPSTDGFDRFHLAAITSVDELADPVSLPLELRFVLTNHPERADDVRRFLERGYGIGIRTVGHTPHRFLTAVEHLSRFTQENTVIPWLPRMLRDGIMPVFCEANIRSAERQGVDLHAEARLIMARRFTFKKIVLIDLENRGLTDADCQLAYFLNQDLYPYAIDYIVHRVMIDLANTRTKIAQNIIKALLLVGPISHVLEMWMRGFGKIFAASADDLLSETAELFALHGSGFTWRQLMRRSRWLVPVFILATWGAFSVEGFIERGSLGIAGLLFGLSAVALSLATALQSVAMFRRSYLQLAKDQKLTEADQRSLFRLALRQDFMNPSRFGLFLGALCSPALAACVFILFPSIIHNGWVLAFLGSTESIVAGLTVLAAPSVNRWWFRRGIERRLRPTLDSSPFSRYPVKT